MKTNTLSFIFFLLTTFSFGQDSEFTTYPNDLIYSESTMKHLTKIVDSLNLQFKSCELKRAFSSVPQSIGTMINLKGGRAIITAARKDIKEGIDLPYFLAKYPTAKTQEKVLVTRQEYTNYQGKEITAYREVNLGEEDGVQIISSNRQEQNLGLAGNWVYQYIKGGSSYNPSIQAFYLPEKLTVQPLPDRYAKLIEYTYCLVDTTVQKIKVDAKKGMVRMPDNWQESSIEDKRFLLEIHRNRRVVGFCSQDDSPRIHAMRIAILSAETANWEIFLRSHLDIMNDRFDRMSDASYARVRRKTYIQELEELDINVIDLILGISLRISNPAENHYFGNIQRIGKALAETKEREELERLLLSMIEDEELDDFNRIISYSIFLNYTYHLEDDTQRAISLKRLAISIDKLPDYLKNKIDLKINK